MQSKNNHLYLSYFMDGKTPLYGGEKGVSVIPDRAIGNGDTANTKRLNLHNHSGTHVDYPNHFFDDGNTSEAYSAEFWMFNTPGFIFCDAVENEILSFSDKDLSPLPSNMDFLIIKTGFGKFRDDEKYWKNNPGLSPDVADTLREKFPLLKAVGMDFISLTSFQNRELGREAHRKFLGGSRPILLIEDMDLSILSKAPSSVVCAPLLIKGLDGSPVTIIALT